MQNQRKGTIKGDIIIGQNCNFEELSKDIFACFKKHDAIPHFRIFEILPNEEEILQNERIKNLIEKTIEKRKNEKA